MPSTSSNQPVWDVGTRLALPSLTGVARADVCVVGLGGSGLSCVSELTRLGVEVVGVDAGEVGGGAAGRNGGFLLAGLARFYHDAVARHGRERVRAMYQGTIDELARIVSESPHSITRAGSLRIAESREEEQDCERQLGAMRADGWPVDTFEGPEGRGLLVHGDGSVQPLERCRTLAAGAIDGGATLFESSPVTCLEPGVVHTAHGRVHARRVVVAVDGSLDLVLPELAAEVRTARLQMLATAPTREVTIQRPVYARWGYDYWQQRADGVVVLGGGRDIGGDAEWTHEHSPSQVVQDALEHRLRTTLGVHAPITHRWAASAGYTSDGLPIAREVRPSVWAIGGYSGTGNVIGSLLGRGMARAIAREDLSLLRPFLHA